MSDLRREIMGKMLPPKSTNVAKKLPLNRTFTPLPWSDFFDSRTTVTIGEDKFNVYLKGSTGPVFYFLHGGGYSGLTWACLSSELSDRIECRIVAPDLRGHGDTVCAEPESLSMERQVEDIAHILHTLFPASTSAGDDPVPVIIVGHSMGGAMVVHTVQRKFATPEDSDGIHMVGVVVIDVVEGTAMDALKGMVGFLHSRPGHFDSEESAIKWCLQSGTTRNSTAARVAFPSQVRKRDDGQYHWRVNLLRSEQYWEGWFRGLSSEFLHCAPPKMLVLAGTDRMDKELMIGQMQGKFQTTLLPRVGHAVHEDSPDRLADELARFAVRNRLATGKRGMVDVHPALF